MQKRFALRKAWYHQVIHFMASFKTADWCQSSQWKHLPSSFFCVCVCLVKAVFKTRGFHEMSEETLIFLMQSDGLQLDEGEILKAMKDWASVNSVSLPFHRSPAYCSTFSLSSHFCWPGLLALQLLHILFSSPSCHGNDCKILRGRTKQYLEMRALTSLVHSSWKEDRNYVCPQAKLLHVLTTRLFTNCLQVVTGESFSEMCKNAVEHVRFPLLDTQELSVVEKENEKKHYIPVRTNKLLRGCRRNIYVVVIIASLF